MSRSIRWYNAQLHNHSTHSDGREAVPDMIDSLVKRGAEVIALTDHNTASGNTEFLKCCRERGIIGVRGNEVSSYYGHVVGLGVEDYIDWRYYTPQNPEALFDDIHERGGICGYAHPIRIGYPLVPGCSWLYQINDYSKLDYFEILNTGDYLRSRNDMVINYWLRSLREGYLQLGATSGLDYHARPYHGHEYVTYLAMDPDEADMEKQTIQTVLNQHMIICKDSFINIGFCDAAGKSYIPGDHVPAGEIRLCINYADPQRIPQKPIVVLDDQRGEIVYSGDTEIRVSPGKFVVVRLYDGAYEFDRLIAVSNPFHVI